MCLIPLGTDVEEGVHEDTMYHSVRISGSNLYS